jgi:3-oxoacyl-[acyl-carrier protein] reductase
MQNNKLPLEGEIALVTGSAGNGIGRATALTLAHQGADIIVNTRQSIDAAQEVVEQIIEMDRKAIVCKADITSENDIKKMVHEAQSKLGSPTIAVIGPGGKWTPTALTDIQINDWEKNMNAEISPILLLAKELLPEMQSQQHGNIVVIGGYDADNWQVAPEEGPYDYALGKSGRHWLVKTLGRKEASNGISINAVSPGPVHRIPNNLIVDILSNNIEPPMQSTYPSQIDVAQTIAWICSQRHIKGSIINMPGPNPGSVN